MFSNFWEYKAPKTPEIDKPSCSDYRWCILPWTIACATMSGSGQAYSKQMPDQGWQAGRRFSTFLSHIFLGQSGLLLRFLGGAALLASRARRWSWTQVWTRDVAEDAAGVFCPERFLTKLAAETYLEVSDALGGGQKLSALIYAIVSKQRLNNILLIVYWCAIDISYTRWSYKKEIHNANYHQILF